MRFLFPEWFHQPFSWLHLGLIALYFKRTDFLLKYPVELKKIQQNFIWKDLEEKIHELFHVEWEGDVPRRIELVSRKHVLVMVPRGFSKTTTINACIVLSILFQLLKIVVYTSESSTHSDTQLGNAKRELETNPRIQAIFGNLRPPLQSGKKWASDEIETTTDIHAISRGRGGQVRGINIGGKRPDLILMDDVEDKESVKTEEQRQKALDWALGDVKPALDPFNPDARIIALGTLLHAEALLTKLAQDPQWSAIVLEALDKDGQPTWPERMPLAVLEAEKASYARLGKLSLYYMEYHNTIRADETAKFTRAMFKYHSPDLGTLRVAIALDPAISEKRGADFAALVAVGIAPGGLITVLDFWAERGASPRTLVDKFFEFYNTWKPSFAGIEAIAYQAALIHSVREEMFRKKTYFELTPITHSRQDGSKLERVEGILRPRFINGYVAFARQFPILEAQLLDWPMGKKDGPDVLAMGIALLDPVAAMAADEDLGKDEYPPLDDVVGGDWRTI